MSLLNSIIVLDIIAGVLAVVLVLANRTLVQYDDVTLDVNDGEEEFTVEGGSTLLEGLIENEVYIPSACGGQGSCGYCTVNVKEGGGPVLPTEEPMLSREQLMEGTRLACQVKVRNDIEVEIEDKYLRIQKYRAEVIKTVDVTPSIVEITFDLKEPETIDFKAGQYVQMQVPTDSGTIDRAYSIASEESMTDKLTLNVQLVEGGVGSTYIHSLEVGDEVEFTGPYGDFVIQDSDKDIIGLAAGVGLAPFRSIVFSLFSEEYTTDREVWLFFGARYKDDMYYKEKFERLEEEHDNFHYVPVRSVPDPDWEGEVGHNTDIVGDYLGEESEKEVYLCGPPPMMQQAIDIFTEEFDVLEEDILFDDFY